LRRCAAPSRAEVMAGCKCRFQKIHTRLARIDKVWDAEGRTAWRTAPLLTKPHLCLDPQFPRFGKGDKEAADQAAVDVMRRVLATIKVRKGGRV
jgi:hypothetical protein